MTDQNAVSKRRDRTKRQPTGKSIRLKERDLDVLTLLYRYTLLDSKMLTSFINPKNHKKFVERLGALYHDGYLLDRPDQQWDSYKARYSPAVYKLAPKGHQVLVEHRTLPLTAVASNQYRIEAPNFQFKHTLKINHAIAAVELECLSNPNQRFVPLEEILNKRRKKHPNANDAIGFPVTIPKSKANPGSTIKTEIIPDGLYGIEYKTDGKKQYKFFAVEVEHKSPHSRRTLKLSSTFKKILAYQAAINSECFKDVLGIPNLFPVFVANDQNHMEKLELIASNILSKSNGKLFRFNYL